VINFGMERYLGTGLYILAIAMILYSLFKRPIAGLYVLVPLIPLQTIRYRLAAYPLGGSFVGIMLLAVMVGLFIKRKSPFAKTPWNILLLSYCAFTFISLCLGSLYLKTPLPFLSSNDARFSDWREYILMPLFLFVVAAAVENRKQMVILIALMCVGALALDKSFWSTVSDRDFSSFSDGLQDPGAMGYAGVNGLAAFEAQFAAFAAALACFERKRLWKIGYIALAAVSCFCLMYSLSRGGYLALIAGFLFLGIVRLRKLLVLMVVFGLVWTSVVPNAVRERVAMTYDSKGGGLDHSSETRVNLWEDAMTVFDNNAAVGTGFNTYAYMGRIGIYKDTHNYFVKVLVETGILGFLLFLALLLRFLWTGLLLYWMGRDPLSKALGLGLAAWMICCMTANLTGDRWSYLQVNGYMWVIAGLAARSWTMEKQADANRSSSRQQAPAVIAEPELIPA
jgi:O-antigen ligase